LYWCPVPWTARWNSNQNHPQILNFSMTIEKLLSIASAATATKVLPSMSAQSGQMGNEFFQKLVQMLSAKNGFYAFEGALHVLPWIDSPTQDHVLGLQAWNEKKLWRDWYQGITDGLFFFAEDVFGGQFAVRGNEIVSFEPETGEIEVLALSFDQWAAEVMRDYVRLTGYSLAHSWQLVNGPIPIGKRLLPKIPFILGGQYVDNNLYAVDAVKGMRYRGEVWGQLRDLPEGAQVRLKVLPLQ
jgi:hypothetical protein